MDKVQFRTPTGLRLPFSTNVLHFEHTCPCAVADCVIRLKKLGSIQLATEIVVVRVDSELQRFHIRTRTFRVHLLEAQGYLKRIDDTNTQITGDVFSSSVANLLFGIAAVIAYAVVSAISFAIGNAIVSFLAVLVGLVAVCLVALYCRQLVENAHHEQGELVKQIQSALG